MGFRQIDCFNIQMRTWKLVAIWPCNFNIYKFNFFYPLIFLSFFVMLYDFLYSINLFFLPRQLDVFAEELLMYFTVLSGLSKVLTFVCHKKNIKKILDILESEIFNPNDEESLKIIEKAKLLAARCYKIVAAVSVTANLSNIFIPIILHFCTKLPLQLPVCTYSFLGDETRNRYIYVLYLYQGLGIHFLMQYNISIGCFFVGLMILTIAQMRVLDAKLRNVTCYQGNVGIGQRHLLEKEASIELALNKCIIHYDQISKFCDLIQDVFSTTLFLQFGMGSCIICACLFRFLLPAPGAYYLFLIMYIIAMVLEIMVPCWFGTQIIVTSTSLSTAVYSCNWTPRSRRFRSSLRLFVERASKPLSITGGKMFLLSLETFTSIMNTSYSFFALLRHMQSRDK